MVTVRSSCCPGTSPSYPSNRRWTSSWSRLFQVFLIDPCFLRKLTRHCGVQVCIETIGKIWVNVPFDVFYRQSCSWLDDNYYFFFLICVTAHQDFFTHFEASQLLGGAKMEDLREKTPDHPQTLGLSHTWPEWGTNPQRWDDEQFRALKISGLNHSATGAWMIIRALYMVWYMYFKHIVLTRLINTTSFCDYRHLHIV